MSRVTGFTLAMTLALTPSSLFAQAVSATLQGLVTDSSGAVVPGATVKATETATGVARKTETNAEGAYTLPYLAPGVYRVEVENQGFKRFVRENIELRVASTVRVDVSIEPGQITETVEVKAETPLLQTDRADVSRSFAEQPVRDLPLPRRSFQYLATLSAGVTPGEETRGAREDPGRTTYFRVNGQGDSSNNSQVDGVDNNEPLTGIIIYMPPVENIREVNVSTSNYTAEAGRAGGAVINVVTRGGTNQVHGSLFEFHQSTHLRARNFFNVPPQAKPASIRNIFGGTVGGPIVRNKTFFFGSYLGNYLRQSTANIATLPVTAWRQGDFAGVPGLNLFDPATGNADGTARQAFAGNRIPASRVHPVTQKLLPRLPAATTSAFNNNFIVNVPFRNDGNTWDQRIDHTFGQSTTLFAKYSFSRYTVLQDVPMGRDIGEGADSKVRTNTASLNVSHSFSPTLLAEFRAGYNRLQTRLNGIEIEKRSPGELGIANPNPDEISQTGLPRIEVSGMLGIGPLVFWPLVNTQNTFNWVTSWTKVQGTHTLKWGVDARRLRLDRFQPQGLNFGPRGLFNFNPGTTALRGGPSLGSFGTFGNSFAAFLLGATDRTGRTYMTVTPTNRTTHFFTFAQDTWRVTPKFTLDYGIRWEMYTPVKPRYRGGSSNYDPSTNSLLVAGYGDIGLSTGVETDWNNFAPRFGFSYNLASKTVVRGGYGISYYTGRFGFTGGTLSTQFPVIYNVQVGQTGDFVVDGTFNSLPPVPFLDIPSNGRISPAPNQAFFVIPGNNRYPYVQSFSLTVQRELPGSIAVDAGYVGTLGRKLPYDRQINAAMPGTGAAGRPLNLRFGRTADTTERGYGVSNNYHSLQVNAARRAAAGLTFTGSYTFSKALDYGSDQASFTANVDINRNYGPANFDRTHMFNLAHLYELPFGPGKRFANSGWLAHMAGQWQINGVFRAVTGTPFTASADATPCNCPGNGNFADVLRAPAKLGNVGVGLKYFDTAAFTIPGANRFGNAGRNTLRGPGFVNYDFSAFRTFTVHERARLEFRAEFYNLTNTPRFANPANSVNSGAFGEITSTLRGEGEREVQLALRLTF